jgi:hypothetical protein
VWSISPHLTNEIRLGYTNQLNFFVPYTLGKGYPAKLGWQFAKADNFPLIQITNFNNSSLPNDSTVLSSEINAVYKEHAYDPSDVVTLIKGTQVNLHRNTSATRRAALPMQTSYLDKRRGGLQIIRQSTVAGRNSRKSSSRTTTRSPRI